jgi:hypothetical protein
VINDYGYKPNPVFHHLDSEFEQAPVILKDSVDAIRKYRQIAYLGLEIEVECDGGRNDFTNGTELFSNLENTLYLKQDGSLHNGFEIVTHPMTLAWATEHFPFELVEKLSEYSFDAWGTSTAGIHVHVSRDAFIGDSHQGRFINLITRNQSFFTALAGRTSNQWAKFDRDNLKNINRRIKRIYHSDRYSAVNVQNVPTLEVRIFRSSLSKRRLLMVMQLVDACVKYTENLTVKEYISGNAFDYEQFADWVSLQADYETLNEYILEFRTTGQIGE